MANSAAPWLYDLVAHELEASGVPSQPRRGRLSFEGFQIVDDPANGRKRIFVATAGDRGIVDVATTAALPTNTLAGNILTASANGAFPAQDGVAVPLGARVLAKNEASQKNGVYILTDAGGAGTPWKLTRATEFDEAHEFASGAVMRVLAGTLSGGRRYVLTVSPSFVLNTDAVVYSIAPPDDVAPPDELGQRVEGAGSGPLAYVKRRGEITINPGESIDRQPEVVAALNSRVGVTVRLVDGPYRFNSGLTIPPGCTLIGSPRGMRIGHRHFAPLECAGSLIKMYGTGKLFTMKYDSALKDVEIYYPNQVVSGSSPIVYDWTVYIAANEHGTSVVNVNPINPYKFLYHSGGGGLIENIIGFPLNEGIHLARCPDVVRIKKIHFNPTNNSSMAQSLIDHVHATMRGVVLDGAEGFNIDDLHVHSSNVGIQFVNEDADGGSNCYGTVSKADIEGTNICVHVPSATGLVEIGGKFTDCTFVPEIGAGHHALLVSDNFTPADHRQNPGLNFKDCSVHSGGGGSDRPVWVQANSHALVNWSHSVWHTFLNEGARNDSPNGKVRLFNIGMPSGATRTGGVGAAVVDVNGYSL